MTVFQPERVLRLLDAVDGLAYALRLICAGQRGRLLRNALILLGCGLCTAAMAYPVIAAG